ncbi:hypothetical protein MRX96_040802 [Rhipicephalus microplus]
MNVVWRRSVLVARGDVTLEDVLSSLLALADSSPSQSRLGTPSKPPASPVSPDIRHVSFALSPSKGSVGLLPDAGHPYGRRCSEGMARPATPISILKHENNRWMGSAAATAEAAAPLAHQTAWASGRRRQDHCAALARPLSRPGSERSSENFPLDVPDRDQRHADDARRSFDATEDSDSENPPPPGFYVSATTTEGYETTTSESVSFVGTGAAAVGDKASSAMAASLHCQWNDCQKPLPKTGGGKIRVHTCPTCYGYFCSRACRNRHRDAKRCALTRISNLCHEVLQKIRLDQVSRQHLSVCAQRGLLSRGRGVIRLVFQGAQRAAQFLERGWSDAGVRGQMFYVARDDLQPHDMGARVYARVRALCDEYDPQRKFVPLGGRKQRLQGLHHVARQLEIRGVDLSACYPELYAKIRAFVDTGEMFSPVCMFPTDVRSGQVFMCVVLPLADQELLDRMAGTRSAAAVKAKKRWMF